MRIGPSERQSSSSTYATILTRVGDLFRRPRIQRAMERITGVVLVGLGLHLATEQR